MEKLEIRYNGYNYFGDLMGIHFDSKEKNIVEFDRELFEVMK
jgi:hypothetical protein